jgi:hypothetical protein
MPGGQIHLTQVTPEIEWCDRLFGTRQESDPWDITPGAEFSEPPAQQQVVMDRDAVELATA